MAERNKRPRLLMTGVGLMAAGLFTFFVLGFVTCGIMSIPGVLIFVAGFIVFIVGLCS